MKIRCSDKQEVVLSEGHWGDWNTNWTTGADDSWWICAAVARWEE